MDALATQSAERARRQRRRSVALAIVLGCIVVLFYVMALIRGPAALHS